MRLTRLRVKNFRSIADIDIPLSPLTVLVGPNGSGKSNVVDALRFVRDVFARGLDQAVMDREGMGVIQRWGTEEISVEVEAYIGESEKEHWVYTNGEHHLVLGKETAKSITYGLTLTKGDRGSTKIFHEKLELLVHDNETGVLEIERREDTVVGRMSGEGFVINTKESAIRIEKAGSGLLMPAGLFYSTEDFFSRYNDEYSFFTEEAEFYPWGDIGNIFSQFDKLISEELFYTLNPNDLRQPQQLLREMPFDEKGKNLAAVLRHISNNNSSSWNSLRVILNRAVTGFDTLEVEPVGGYLATKLIYQTDTTQPRTSYLGQESDGTIRMLGILAALYQDPAQPFLSIEEPEANIHPGALAVLASVLDEASLRSQILVTTHSPDMLDHLPAESFLVVEKVGDTTHVGPLAASQLASVRKRLFTPGELLRMEGLQRQPTPDAAA